jgi:hypothetical protein
MEAYTDIERANLNFFGNMVNVSSQIEEIKSYLHEIHKYIDVTSYHLNQNNIKRYDPETLENLKYHYEHTHGENLRKSIIISSIIILESEIDNYCQDFQKHRKLKVSYRDFKGDVLDKFKFYSQKILNSTYDFGRTEWQDIIGLLEIRNCLIHNRGSLDNFGKRKSVEQFINRYSSFTITDNEFIHISQKGCADSLKIINNFFEEITSFALDFFPGRYERKQKT